MRIDLSAEGETAGAARAAVEVWGGFECTVARIGDEYRDLVLETGHRDWLEQLDAVAGLGIRTLRYPVLWEHVAPDHPQRKDWRWHDQRLARLTRLGVAPIAGLLHHGSGPRYTDLLDPDFPALLADYAEQVALRYPHVEMFTPVNEPVTTARFSCLYGLWYPHHKETHSFLRALFNQCYGTVLAMRRIRHTTPSACLVQTEDIGKTFSTPSLRHQAEYQNERRWLSLDLLCGWVDRRHRWFDRFRDAGVSEAALLDLNDRPCRPDIIGINYYLTTDRFLDQRRRRYPQSSWGGNGRQLYADVEATRTARADLDVGVTARLREVWQRYGVTVAVTEVHNGCTREEQLRWLTEVYADAADLRTEGVDLRAVGVWAVVGSIDWHCMLTRRDGHYECGLFDSRRPERLRPTALAKATAALASAGSFDHPAIEGPGWWRRDTRYYRSPRREKSSGVLRRRRLLVTGATGTLGRAFARILETRGLDYMLTSRAQLEIAEPASVKAALEQIRPWAVINTAGYVRVAEADREPERCFRENSTGASVLAEACARSGIHLVTFSSDLVFDGRLGRAYVEDDTTSPTCVYGASKAEAERRVLDTHSDALVIRTSAFFGPWDPYNFVYHTLRALAASEQLRLGTDCVVSPTYVPDLVNASLDLLIDRETGIWHLANRGAVSWGELARIVAHRGGFDRERIALETCNGIVTNTALDSSRGEIMPTLDSALDRFFKEAEQSWAPEPARPSR